MRRTILLILVLTLVPAAVAHASASAVIRDCTDDGKLQGTYSQKDLRNALANLPSDVDEYTNCRDVIRAAQLSASAGGGSGEGSGPSATSGGGTTGGGSAGGGGTSAGASTGSSPGAFGGFSGYPADPSKGTGSEQQALAAAQLPGPGAAALRDTAVSAGVLPAPLIVALALGALALLATGAVDLRRRLRERRGA